MILYGNIEKIYYKKMEVAASEMEIIYEEKNDFNCINISSMGSYVLCHTAAY